MDIFLSAPTSCRIWNTQWMQEDQQIQIVPVAICLIIFGFMISYSFSPWRYSRAHQVVISVSPIMLTIKRRMHNIIQLIVYAGWSWEWVKFYSELYSVYSHSTALHWQIQAEKLRWSNVLISLEWNSWKQNNVMCLRACTEYIVESLFKTWCPFGAGS